MKKTTYDDLFKLHAESLAGHHLEVVQDRGPVKAWYLRRDKGRMMSVLIVLTPEGLVITGDFCPNQNGAISAYGYGLKWFVGSGLGADYLAEKFLARGYHEDDAEDWFRYELEDVKKEIEEETDADYVESLHTRKEAIEEILQGGQFHEADIAGLWQEVAVDCEDWPGCSYDRGDKAILAAIQQRFAALFWMKYARISDLGDPVPHDDVIPFG